MYGLPVFSPNSWSNSVKRLFSNQCLDDICIFVFLCVTSEWKKERKELTTGLSIGALDTLTDRFIEKLQRVQIHAYLPEKGGEDYSGRIKNNFHVASCKEMWESVFYFLKPVLSEDRLVGLAAFFFGTAVHDQYQHQQI